MWTMNDVRPSPTYVLVAGKQGLPFSVYSPAGQGLVGLGNCGTWMDPVMFSQRHKIYQRLHKPIYQHAQNWHLTCCCSAPAPNKPPPLNLNVPGLSTSMGYLNYLLLSLSPNHAQEITRKSQWNIWLMYMSLVHYTSTKIWSTEHFIISQMCSIQNNQQCNGMDMSLLFFFSCSCSTPAPVRQLPTHPSIHQWHIKLLANLNYAHSTFRCAALTSIKGEKKRWQEKKERGTAHNHEDKWIYHIGKGGRPP